MLHYYDALFNCNRFICFVCISETAGVLGGGGELPPLLLKYGNEGLSKIQCRARPLLIFVS